MGLQDAFDQFFTLFVAFNRLYSYTAQVAGQGNAGDRRMATRLFAEIVGHQTLLRAITSDGGADIELLRQLIEPNGSFFLISGPNPDIPDTERNADLHRRLGNVSACVAAEAVLEYLYQVRCNMFHGSKGFEDRQLQLLQPCLRVLRRVVDAGLGTLESNHAV
jgi:hypothetical protein